MSNDKDMIRIDAKVKIPDELKKVTPIGLLDFILQKKSRGVVFFDGFAMHYLLKAVESDDKKIQQECIKKAKKILYSNNKHNTEAVKRLLSFIHM